MAYKSRFYQQKYQGQEQNNVESNDNSRYKSQFYRSGAYKNAEGASGLKPTETKERLNTELWQRVDNNSVTNTPRKQTANITHMGSVSENSYGSNQQSEYERLLNLNPQKAKASIQSLRTQIEKIPNYSSEELREKYPNHQAAVKHMSDLEDQIKKIEEDIQKSEKIKKYASYQNAEDFLQFSSKGAAIKNPTYKEAEGNAYIFGWRPGADPVGNIVTYSRDNYEHIRDEENGESRGVGAVGKSLYHYMSDDEVGLYNYILAKHGDKEAKEYLDSIEETLNYRSGTEQAKLIRDNENGFLRTLGTVNYGVGAGLDQSISGAKQFFSDEKLPTSATQYGSAYIREDLEDAGPKILGSSLGQIGYDTLTTTANMAPSILLSSITAGLGAPAAVASGLGAASMGLSASGNAYGQALSEGYGKEEARSYSLLVGASEAALQYLLGGISKLGGKLTGNVAKKTVQNIDNALLRIAVDTGIHMAGEGSEEYLQEILEPAFRNLCFDENNEIKLVSEDAAYSFLLGALTSGFMEGGNIAKSGISLNKTGEAIQRQGKYEELLENALTMAPSSEAGRIASQLKNGTLHVNSSNIGELYLNYAAEGGSLDFVSAPVENTETGQEPAQQNPEAALYQAAMGVVTGGDSTVSGAEQVKMGAQSFGKLGQEAAVEFYDSSMDAEKYFGGFSAYYEAGKQGKDINTVSSPYIEVLNKTQRQGAYMAGQVDARNVGREDGAATSNSAVSSAAYTAHANSQLQRGKSLGENGKKAFQTVLRANPESMSANPLSYYKGFMDYYNAGVNGIKQRKIQSQYGYILDKSQQYAAYASGQRDAAASLKAEKAAVNQSAVYKAGEGKATIENNLAGLVENEYSGRLNETVKSQLHEEARALGLKAVIDESISSDGRQSNGNGKLIDGILHISADASDPIGVVRRHEITHRLQELAPEQYRKFRDYAMKFQENVTGDILNKQVLYGKNGQKLSNEEAMDEIAADFAGKMLDDEAAIQRMVRENRTLAEKVRDIIRNMVQQVKEVIGKADPTLERAQKLWDDAFKAAEKQVSQIQEQKNTASESGMGRYSIKYDENNQPFVVVDEDILDGVPKNQWVKAVKNNLREKFPEGVTVGNNIIHINQQSRREMTFSKYMQQLLRQNPQIYADKFRATNNADEILKASRNYVNEALLHPRKDAIIDFARGEVMLRIGNNEYSAQVIIGNRENGSLMLYDIINLSPINIQQSTKKVDADYTTKPQKETGSRQSVSTTTSISNSSENVNGKFSLKDPSPEARAEKLEPNMIQDILNHQAKMTPAQIAQLTEKDANTTPKLNPKAPSGINQSNGKESKFYQSILDSQNIKKETKHLINTIDDIKYYAGISNIDTLNAANKKLNENGEKETLRFVGIGKGKADAVDVAEGFILLKRYQDVGDYESATVVLQKLREMGTKAGQTVQAFSLLGRMTPEGMMVYAQKELDSAFREMVNKKGEKWAENHREMFQLTPEEMQFIQSNIQKASQLPEGRDKNILIAEISSMLEAKLPTNILRQIKGYTRNCMLLNPKTMIRNVVGNAIMMPEYIVQDFIGSTVDKIISKKTGVRTTGNTLPNREGLKAAKKGVFESFDDFRRHINTRSVEMDRFEVGNGDTFKHYTSEQKRQAGFLRQRTMELSNVMNKIDRLTGFLLDVGDRPFFEYHFTNSLNNQMKLNHVIDPTAEMIDIATNEALQRTWQDDNKMTKCVTKIRNLLNGGKEWGLGSMVVPFTKTPANLVKALIDYSPVGLVDSLARKAVVYHRSIKSSHFDVRTQKAFVDSFSKAITGTLFMILGGVLTHFDLLSGGDDDKDKDLAAFQQNILGLAPYSVKIGNMSFTYDWAQPVAGQFAISADFVQNLKNGNEAKVSGLDVLGKTGKTILNALAAGGNTIYEQSFLQGISDLFKEGDLMTGLINASLNSTSQFVPTALSQIAQIADPYARTSFEYRDSLTTAKNKAVAKIPGLRNDLAPVVDVLGHDVQSYGGHNNPFNVFLNPANLYEKSATKAAKEIYRVYEETGDVTIIPRKSPYYIEYKGSRYNFTSHERASYQKTAGQTNEKIVNDLLSSQSYSNLGDDQRAQVLSTLTDYADSVAKYQYLKEKGVTYERDSWMLEAEEGAKSGVRVADYIVAYVLTKNIKGMKDRNGDPIANSKSLRIMEQVYSIKGLYDEQRKYLFESFGVGKKVRHYNKALVNSELAQMEKQ